MAIRVNRRNRRQVSLEQPPVSVPLMMYVFSCTSDANEFVRFNLRDGATGGPIPADYISVNYVPDIQLSGGANCVSIETTNDGGNSIVTLEFDAGPVDGQTIRWPQWEAAVRGFNGEWLAPMEQVIQLE